MPSTSKKQRKFMRIAAHNKEFARKNDIPQSVAKEFYEADKNKQKTSAKIKKRYGKEN